jgi:hypothetical protein
MRNTRPSAGVAGSGAAARRLRDPLPARCTLGQLTPPQLRSILDKLMSRMGTPPVSPEDA